jgi:hypothetical protein
MMTTCPSFLNRSNFAFDGIYTFSNAMGLSAEIPEVTDKIQKTASKTFANDASWVYSVHKNFPSPEGVSPIISVSHSIVEEGPTVSQYASMEAITTSSYVLGLGLGLGLFALGSLFAFKAFRNDKDILLLPRGPDIQFPNGDKYFGQVKNGKMNGQGIIKTIKGEEYSGIFEDNLIKDQATIKFPNGNIFVGEVIDLMNGRGTITTPDGRKYVGELNNGNMQCQVYLITSNGEEHFEEVKKDDEIVKWMQDLMEDNIDEEKSKIIKTINSIKNNQEVNLKQIAFDAIRFIQYSKPERKNSDINLDRCAEIIKHFLDPAVIVKYEIEKFIPDKDRKQSLLNNVFTTFIENYLNYQKENPTKKIYDNLCLEIFKTYKEKFHAEITIKTVNELFLKKPNDIAQKITKQMSSFYLSLISSKGRFGELQAVNAINIVSPTIMTIPASKKFIKAILIGFSQRYNSAYIKNSILPFIIFKYSKAYESIAAKIPGFADQINVSQVKIPQITETLPFNMDTSPLAGDALKSPLKDAKINKIKKTIHFTKKNPSQSSIKAKTKSNLEKTHQSLEQKNESGKIFENLNVYEKDDNSLKFALIEGKK